MQFSPAVSASSTPSRSWAQVAADLLDPPAADLGAVEYFYDPAGWAADCIRWPAGRGLAAYQAEILAALPGRQRVSARGMHGLGKTTIASVAVLWFAITRDLAGCDWKVPTTASVWRQLEKYLWPEIHKWARLINWDRAGRRPFTRAELMVLSLKLDSGAAFAVASDDPTAIEGAHADHLLYVFDESKAISDATFDAAEGAFSTAGKGGTEAYALAMSTPGEPQGRFYDIHSRRPGTEDWWARHVTLDEAIDAGRVTREWADRRAALWTPGSAIYQNRVLGEFASSDEDGVIPLAWVEQANERWRATFADVATDRDQADGTAKVVGPGQPLTSVGVDVARGGQDRTVFALCDGHAVLELRRYPASNDTMATVAHVQAVQEAHGRPKAAVDVIGIGAGVVDRLRELKLPVAAFGASEGTTNKDVSGELGFTNKRSAAWWNLRELLDPASDVDVLLPPDDRLTGDLVAPKWKVVAGGRIQIESKDDIRKRLGRSTDDGDAVVMGLWDPRGVGDTWLAAWSRMAADEAEAKPSPTPPQLPPSSLGRLSDLIRR